MLRYSRRARRTLEVIEKIAVIIGVPLLLVVAYASWKASTAATTASLLAERSARLAQRAWISVDQFELDREPIDGQPITVRASLRNRGTTPATSVVVKSRVSILEHQRGDDWSGIDNEIAAVVFPTVSGNALVRSVDVQSGTTAAYVAGIVRIWVTGRIEYEDVFGRHHWLVFCAYHLPQQGLALFSFCQTGNYIDGE
jgi:hypothetical protein